MFQLILSGYSRSIETVLLEVLSDKVPVDFLSVAADLSLFQRRFRERDPDFSGFSRKFHGVAAGLLDSLSQLILSGFSAATRPPCGSGWTTGNAT
jgi:hypothetical protein